MVGHTLGYAELMIDSLLSNCPDEFLRRQLLHKRGELMSALDKLEERIKDNAEMVFSQGQTTSTSIIPPEVLAVLISAIKQSLMALIESCMGRISSDEQLAMQLRKPGDRTRRRLESAIKRNQRIPKEHRAGALETAINALRETNEQDSLQIVRELRDGKEIDDETERRLVEWSI